MGKEHRSAGAGQDAPDFHHAQRDIGHRDAAQAARPRRVDSQRYQGGTWSESEVKSSCRHIILGTAREVEGPGTDLYLWAGGRFRIAPEQSPQEIDFEQFWRGTVLPASHFKTLGS